MNTTTQQLLAAKREVTMLLLSNTPLTDVHRADLVVYINKLAFELSDEAPSDKPPRIDRVRNFLASKLSAVASKVAAPPSTPGNMGTQPSNPVAKREVTE